MLDPACFWLPSNRLGPEPGSHISQIQAKWCPDLSCLRASVKEKIGREGEVEVPARLSHLSIIPTTLGWQGPPAWAFLNGADGTSTMPRLWHETVCLLLVVTV